jgi:hypothetical protein
MNTILGANWRTTLSGWLAVIASAIAINPSLVAFLPDATRTYVTGLAGIVAVLSGGTFATQAKDKRVTGGNVPNDATPSANATPTRLIAPLIVATLLPLFALSGCAWVQTHKPQIDATLAVVGQRALAVAENVLISVAVDEADKSFKADFVDSVASGLRQNETTIVNSDDVSKIVQIWSPNDGAQWQQLAGSLGTVAGNALQSAGKTQSAAVVENIATGLNNAAAAARATPAAQ